MLLLLISMTSLANEPYTQIRFPLDNGKGVPFAMAEGDWLVKGFDVDGQGYFYFLGGNDRTYFSCFDENGLLYSRQVAGYGEIYWLNDTLYLFDNSYDWEQKVYHKDLVAINPANGDIISRRANITDDWINAYNFIPEGLVLELHGNDFKPSPPTFSYELYSYQGEFIKSMDNLYGLPPGAGGDMLYPIGRRNGLFLFFQVDIISPDTFPLVLMDAQGNTVGKAVLDDDLLGKVFYPNPLCHYKIRNDNLYVLRRDSSNAVVSIISLKELFSLAKAKNFGSFPKSQTCTRRADWNNCDTTFLQYMDVNTDGLMDTLITDLVKSNDTIYVSYFLKDQQTVIEVGNFIDTYLSSLSDCSKKKDWFDFVKYGSDIDVFEFSDFKHLTSFAIEFGMNDLKKHGFNIDKEEYKDYLQSYKGTLFAYGHPEMQEGLFIWYEPLKRFVLFYHP